MLPLSPPTGTLVGSVGLDVLMTKLLDISTEDEISSAIDARGALCFGMELTESPRRLQSREQER